MFLCFFFSFSPPLLPLSLFKFVFPVVGGAPEVVAPFFFFFIITTGG